MTRMFDCGAGDWLSFGAALTEPEAPIGLMSIASNTTRLVTRQIFVRIFEILLKKYVYS